MPVTRRTFFATIGAGIPLLADGGVQKPSTSHETAFRNGNFQLAVSLAEAVLAKDPGDVRARLTKLRVYDAHFRTDMAQTELRDILSKSSNRPVVLAALPELSFAENMPDLMDEYLRSSPADSLGAERIRALRLWTKRAGADGLCRAMFSKQLSTDKAFLLRYSPDNPGLIGLRTTINGHQPLTLLLNSSAFGLWLPPTKARAVRVETLGEGWISEPGITGVAKGAYGLAEHVETGGAVIRNVPVFTAPGRPFDLFDGIIGTSAFRYINVELHPSEPKVAFTQPKPQSQQRIVQCVRSRHVPLLHGHIEGRPTLILIQLQAEISVAQRTPPLQVYPNESNDTYLEWLTGATCKADSDTFASIAKFEIAGDARKILTRRCDLSETSAKLGLTIGGVAGLNAFQNDGIILDQTRGLVGFE